jgi:hypothetical protein
MIIGGARWSPQRLEAIQLSMQQTWLRPSEAAAAMNVCRGTIHNRMADGGLRFAYLGGRKLRSVSARDVLGSVLRELDAEQEQNSDLPHILSVLARNIREHLDTEREQEQQ